MRKIVLLLVVLLLVHPVNIGIAAGSNMCEELTMREKKELLTKIALKHEIPPEILKTIALFETKMTQCVNGKPLISNDGGIGIMQITETDLDVDEERLKYDTAYNIEIAAKTLKNKWDMQNNGRIPEINNSNPIILENWYFAIMAYNGLSEKNDPNKYPDNTYQEKFFKELEKYNNIKISEIPDFDVEYDNGIITFPYDKVSWPNANTLSSQMFKKGDTAFVSNQNGVTYGNLRQEPSVNSTLLEKIPFFEKVQIVSGPYIERSNDFNYFVMYEVKGDNFSGFMASSNLNPMQYINNTMTLVNTTKAWKIPVHVELTSESVNNNTIFIVNKHGERQKSTLAYNKNEKVIRVKPDSSLTPGEVYTLYIQNLRTSTGLPMELPVAMSFKVKANNSANNIMAISVKINNEIHSFTQSPVIEQGRTLVPIRGIFETLGANVNWNASAKLVTAQKGDTSIYLPIGNIQPKVNGLPVKIDVPAKIVNGRTMVPLRFIGESLGAYVAWDDQTKTVIIQDDSFYPEQAIGNLNNSFIDIPS